MHLKPRTISFLVKYCAIKYENANPLVYITSFLFFINKSIKSLISLSSINANSSSNSTP